MRKGFTTGSCAAAASKAAVYMLLSGNTKQCMSTMTPAGVKYDARLHDIRINTDRVSCAVIKDGGDDPDITSGAYIYSEARIIKKYEAGDSVKVTIEGGKGVGRVTKPGLDQPVGRAAINSVPREMITKEVCDVCSLFDFHGEIGITISVPDGEELAEKTFNPRLGITGGISIIGTSGIVEPMSTKALIDTIRTEILQQKALGRRVLAIAPGNYGRDHLKKSYGYDIEYSVKCSNFIGETLDMAVEAGFDKILLTGNIGKIVKLAGGIMNTHSREADCRMEILAANALLQGVSPETCRMILECVMTDEAVRLIDEEGKKDDVMNALMKKVMFYLDKRLNGRAKAECIMYSEKYDELSKSEGADTWLTLLAQDAEHPI